MNCHVLPALLFVKIACQTIGDAIFVVAKIRAVPPETPGQLIVTLLFVFSVMLIVVGGMNEGRHAGVVPRELRWLKLTVPWANTLAAAVNAKTVSISFFIGLFIGGCRPCFFALRLFWNLARTIFNEIANEFQAGATRPQDNSPSIICLLPCHQGVSPSFPATPAKRLPHLAAPAQTKGGSSQLKRCPAFSPPVT